MEYLELELEIERAAGERYRARVIDSPAGGRAQNDFDLPSGATKWQTECESALRAGERHLESQSPARDTTAARDLGTELFDRVLAPGPVRARWRTSLAEARAERKGLRLRLRLPDDPRLLEVPWELLYDPQEGGFLAQSEETPVVRSLEVAGRRRRMMVDGTVRCLVMLSCPPGVVPLQVEKELESLKQALAARIAKGQASLEHLTRPTLPDLSRYLQTHECHVLHFIGHGMGGALALENAGGEALWVDDDKLATFFGHRELRVVVLNACQCAAPGQKLIRRGVPAVIAMQCDVSDDVAVELARHFYQALAEGLPVDGAMSRARLAIFASFEGPAWAIPVLYMNTRDGQIWGKQKSSLLARIIAVAAVVAALVGTGSLFFRWAEHEIPPEPGNEDVLQPPRDSSSNPRECPSPPGLNMAFVKIDPGTFIMGDEGMKESRPTHQVTITRPFCIGAYEVTQELWARVFRSPQPGEKDRYLPVHGIQYGAAQDFIRLVNEKDPAHSYRLPTEAEWEYVARGKTQMRYSFLDDSAALVLHANCGEIGDGFDGPTWVGQFPANHWGAHDMYGNVFEWVSDWNGPYSDEDVEDPRGPLQGEKRIRRGGSWKSGAKACSSAARSDVEPDRNDQQNGFRIVREIR